MGVGVGVGNTEAAVKVLLTEVSVSEKNASVTLYEINTREPKNISIKNLFKVFIIFLCHCEPRQRRGVAIYISKIASSLYSSQ